MNTDMKWFVIGVVLLFIMPMFSLMFDHYQKGQCRIVAIQANVPVSDIDKACNK